MEDPSKLTSYHVRRAREGSAESLEWVIGKFSPILLANARYRLRTLLNSIYDPEDVVQEVWAVVVPKLSSLVPQDERYTPVFMKFLSTTLIYHINNLVKKHIRGKPVAVKRTDSERSVNRNPVDDVAGEVTGVITRMVKREKTDALLGKLRELETRDQEIVVLRGIEQHPYEEIATLLHEDRKVLAVRYQRALDKLRRLLPGSIFDEFSDQ